MRNHSSRSGFTLLEAMVALAIVALVCIGVLGGYGNALRADARAVDRMPLAALAVERVAAIDIGALSLDRIPDSLAAGVFNKPYEDIAWSAAAVPVRNAAGLYDVVVQVRDRNDAYTLRTRRYRTTSYASTTR